MKWNRLLFVLLACCLFLTGCWSQKEMTDLAIVSAMGIDLTEEGRYVASLQVINPSNVAGGLQGGGGTQGPPVTVYTATGDNIVEMNRRASALLPRRRYYAHTNLVVIGEELARKEGIVNILDAIERHHEFRMTAIIVIAQGSTASDLVKVLTGFEKVPAQKIIKNLKFAEKQWGAFLKTNLQDTVKDLSSAGKEPVITGFRFDGDPKRGRKLENTEATVPSTTIKASALGIMKDGKLVDWIERDAARGTVWILDKIARTAVSVDWKDKKDAITYDVIRQNTKKTPKIKNGQPTMSIAVKVEGSIGEAGVFVDLTDPHVLLRIEKELEKEIEQELRVAIEQAQKNKSDVLGFGQDFYRSNPKEWKKWKDEWHDVYFPELKVDIKVSAYIRRTGLRNKPLQLNQES